MSIVAIGIVAYAFDLPMRGDERLVVPWKAGLTGCGVPAGHRGMPSVGLSRPAGRLAAP